MKKQRNDVFINAFHFFLHITCCSKSNHANCYVYIAPISKTLEQPKIACQAKSFVNH